MDRREVVTAMVAGLMFGRKDGPTERRSESSTSADRHSVIPSFRPSAVPSPAGRLKQSVSYWPYSRIPLAEFARECKQIRLAAIDLLQPEEWPVVRDAGLVCSMGYPTKRRDFLSTGFNDPTKHDMLVE